MDDNTKKLLGLERCVLLQALAESYLLRKTGKHFYEEYPDVKEEYGLLVKEHVGLLREYLTEEYKARQLDLNACIEKTGEVVTEDRLTDYESSAVIRIVDDIIFTYSTVEERKKRFLNK